jgi:glycosyltransferase involved in cell wall biosynthesis
MIGDGPLMGVCEDLVRSLDMSHAVTFLGPQSHETVRVEMQRARAFVQHSVVAANGDSEGTPVAILEAGAAGLPVIATLHAGIPDVVIHGSTGFLVPERDINAMAEYLIRIVRNSALADEMGRSARNHVSGNFTVEKSLRGLATILEKAARR